MNQVLGSLLRELLKHVDAEDVKDVMDGVMDKIEAKVAATPNKYDDAVINPLIETIRRLAGIEDKKYGSDKEPS